MYLLVVFRKVKMTKFANLIWLIPPLDFPKCSILDVWRDSTYTCGIHHWLILKNHGNIINIRLFQQTTKQPLSNYEPWKLQIFKQIEGWGQPLVA